MNAEQQLTALGLTLPAAPPRGGVYKPVVIVGNIAYVSGHGPYLGDGEYLTGRVGADLDLEEIAYTESEQLLARIFQTQNI